MRTPERCPWCGADENIRPDGVRTGTYGCTWRIGARQSWCNRFASRAAQDYRQALAWRKRLSQHTGVPLRMIPEPTETGLSENKRPYASWGFDGWAICVGVKLDLQEVGYDGKARWHGYDLGIDARFIRSEARRRLLAKGE